MNSVLEAFKAMGNPAAYVESLGKKPFEWQKRVLDPRNKRICLLAARQSGKSLIVSGLAVHKAKMKPGALITILAPKEKQAQETARKVKDFIKVDPELKTIRDNDMEVELSNGSRIVNVVANDNSPRGYSDTDLIIMDEASRIPDLAYSAVRPTMSHNPNVVLILLSTPYGKTGFFWRAWSSVPGEPEDDDDEQPIAWKKIRVEIPFALTRKGKGLKVVHSPVTPEELREKWEPKGVEAFFSPNHRLSFLREELQELGEWMWKQEYGIEFVESKENIFDYEDIMAALRSDSTAIMQDTADEYTASTEALVF